MPGDTTDFLSVTNLTVKVNVAQATPQVKVNPLNLTFGTALSNKSQLTGTASFTVNGKSVSVAGALTYTSAAGTVLGAGNGQTAAVTFTPTDATDYTTLTNLLVAINVAQATPQVTVNPVNIPIGTALSNSQLAGTATFTVNGKSVNVAGVFAFTSGVGTVLTPGAHSLQVSFTPTDAADYLPVVAAVTVTVGKTKPQVVVNPVSFIYGTLLANSQLSGAATTTVNGKTVNVPGTFTYTSAEVGTLLSAGSHTETVTFTPNDTTDFQAVTTTVTVNVAKATPVFSNFVLQHPSVPSGSGDIVSGKLSAGAAPATGSLTLNILPFSSVLSANGTFAINMLTIDLHGLIQITIHYAGNTNFNAAAFSFLIDVM